VKALFYGLFMPVLLVHFIFIKFAIVVFRHNMLTNYNQIYTHIHIFLYTLYHLCFFFYYYTIYKCR